MSAVLRVVPLRPWLAGAWDAFVLAHPGGWFWHTTEWLDYQVAYGRGLSESLSFAVLDESHAVAAVVPLVLYRPVGLAPELSYAGDPLPLPLAATPEAGTLVASEMRRRAYLASGARAWTTAASPFGGAARVASGGAAQRVVELGPGGPDWSGVRRSYRSLIHAGERRYAISVRTGPGAGDAFAAYQRLHRAQAARPRPDETYRMQWRWLEDGRALVAVAEDATVVWGAAYWYLYKGAAYYGSGAYAARDVAHAVVWRSLCALRDLGVLRASLGWQGVARTGKEQQIEFFKRGFGGVDVPAPIVEQGEDA